MNFLAIAVTAENSSWLGKTEEPLAITIESRLELN
jgi:hypothetical protein